MEDGLFKGTWTEKERTFEFFWLIGNLLQKLISYGHLEGEAGLEGGKNTERVTKILNLVCASVDGTSPDRLSSSKVACLKTSVFLSLFLLFLFFLFFSLLGLVE
jgi:hypothetical protein